MALNSIRISGKIVCDYIWCVNRELTPDERKTISNPENEPKWTMDTGLLVTFNDTLLAGNITEGTSAPIMHVYRRDVATGSMDLAAVTDGVQTAITDYNVVNNKEYEYVLFAETDGAIASPITSPPIKTSWENYCLFDADETEVEGRFKMHDCFLFDHNINSGTMSNNLSVAKFDNFTRYPKFMKSKANYYSSTLTGLLGHLDKDGNYFDSAEMLDALCEFTASTRRKFLKDTKGHILCVEISAPLQQTAWDNYGGVDPYNVSIPWTECDTTKGKIIN